MERLTSLQECKIMKRITAFLLSVLLIFCISSVDVFANEARVFRKSSGSTKKIALTFDDGPHPRLTPKVLEILNEYKIEATFFVIGQNAVDYPETMKLLAESGYEIGNHTFSHRDLSGKNEDEMKKEILECSRLLSESYGINISLLRPPRGKYDEVLTRVGEELDIDIILWNIDTKDWAHTSAQDIAKKVLGSVKGGDIILMHDFIGHSGHTCEALRLIIPELLERGFEFVAVSELIRNEI